ncbi:hypothetical protein QYE76_000989 [Lolium multiflorum]|uniref:Uncharacterized protein n=1 Tax=Lolium multiflorum TaxID=4521 RepID=A0AAD8VY61_LOLMU|nr:hypothetical protein QYE76_000989 [Lolium multiflorum]
MYGPGDPTKITGLPLSKGDVVLKAKQICQTDMPGDWEWGFLPLSSTNPPTDEAKDRFPRIESDRRGPCRKRPLDKVDPDPYVHWTDLKMGRIPHSRIPVTFQVEAPGSSDDLTILEVHEHVVPLHAEVGHEFLEKLIPQSKKNKAPAPDAGSSQAPPAKRFRTEVLGGKETGKRRYQGKTMPPCAQALQERPAAQNRRATRNRRDLNSSSSLGPGTIGAISLRLPCGGTSNAGAAPPLTTRGGGPHPPLEKQDTGASNTGADDEAAGWAEPLVPLAPKKKKKKNSNSSPSKPVPDTSVPASSTPPLETPILEPTGATPTPPPSQGPSAAKPTPPPEGSKVRVSEPFKGKATASSTSSACQQSLVLHVGRAAAVAGEQPSGLLGRITELKREGRELGHLLPYAQKWNAADVSAATRGLGKDRLPAPDPAGPRSTEEHFMRLRRSVKELENAWHDATNNMVSTAKARRHLLEELLWEHRDLAEAHSKCQAIPEASLEALKTQVAKLQDEKEQLIKEHRKALDAQELYSKGLKDQLIQLGLKHNEAMKAAQAAAEAKLNEALEDANNSTVVARSLSRGAKALRTGPHAGLFPDSQLFAQKKVAERRIQQEYKN